MACLLTPALHRQACAAELTGPDHFWSVDELVVELQHSNPQLEQARQAYLAAQLQVSQADALPAPQLGLIEQANTGGHFNFKPDSGFYAYPSFTQPLLWPGKRRLAGEIASAQAEVVGRQYDSLLIQLVAQLKLSVYQLAALREKQRFMDEDLQRLEQIKQISKVRYANNAAAYVEFLNAQVAASSLENDRFGLQKQIQQQTEQINVLIGRSSQSPLEIREQSSHPQLPGLGLNELIDLAQKNNPVVAGGQLQTDAADKAVQLAQKEFFPDFSVVVGLYTDPYLDHPDSTRMYSVGININLPTWGFSKEKAGLSQARALLDAAQNNQKANLQQLDVTVASDYHNLETALQQLRFMRERLLPQAQTAYRLALTGYSSQGGIAFSDLLTAQSNLHGTELSLIQAENSALQAYITLAAVIGRDPV